MKSFPHDSVNHDRLYSASDFRDFFIPFVTNGVFVNPANSCMVTSLNRDRSVVINSGRCYINGCVGYTDGTETLIIPSSDMYNSRYDIVAARLDLEKRDIHLELITGTPDENPEYPPILRTELKWDLALAAIKSSPFAYEITQADITDLRFNLDYCGIVSGLITLTDTTGLFSQYEQAWIDFVSQLGENDHVTINTIDPTARRMANENRIRMLSPLDNFLL